CRGACPRDLGPGSERRRAGNLSFAGRRTVSTEHAGQSRTVTSLGRAGVSSRLSDSLLPLAADPGREKMRAEDLHLFFGKVEAIKGVTLPIVAEKVTAVIGPSGCGKSTFIRSLNRMHELVPGTRIDGRVLLDSKDIYAPGTDPVTVRRR